jgi:hypothetical protein
MQRLLCAILLCHASLTASTIYRVSFEALINSGSVTSLSRPVSPNLAGLKLFGLMEYDLSLAPQAVVNSADPGFLTTFGSTTDPVWITRRLVWIEGNPDFGPDFANSLDFPPVPMPNGATATQPANRNQSIQITASSSSAYLTNSDFLDNWVSGSLIRRRGSLLAWNIFSPTPFLQQVGGLQDFSASQNVGGGGVFSANDFEWDTNNLFFTTNNSINVSFRMISARGETIVTPEPAAITLMGMGLAMLLVHRHKLRT